MDDLDRSTLPEWVPAMSESPEDLRNIGPLAIAFEGGVVALALAICWGAGRWPPLASGAGLGNAMLLVWGVAGALPMIAGLFLIDRWPVGPLAELKRFVETTLVPMFAGVSVLQMALISLAAGLGEEMLFRGLLQTAVAERVGPPHGLWVGLAIAALAFGACHWVTTMYACLAGLMGAYFGVLFIATGDLLTPVVAHGLYDFVALVYLVRCKSVTVGRAPGDQEDGGTSRDHAE